MHCHHLPLRWAGITHAQPSVAQTPADVWVAYRWISASLSGQWCRTGVRGAKPANGSLWGTARARSNYCVICLIGPPLHCTPAPCNLLFVLLLYARVSGRRGGGKEGEGREGTGAHTLQWPRLMNAHQGPWLPSSEESARRLERTA